MSLRAQFRPPKKTQEAQEAQALNEPPAAIAVDDISFTIGHGKIAALLGTNDVGKTTTIAILLGLRLPDSGQITVLGGNPGTA